MGFQLFLLFFLLAAACSLAVLIRRTFEETLPLVFYGIVFVLFAFGMVYLLEFGIWFILGIGFALLMAAAVKLIRDRKQGTIPDSLKRIFTPALFLFVILFAVLSFLNRGRVMYNWDELSHWGSTVKEMLIYKHFGTVAEAEPLYGAYPPGMALFQYFVLRLNGLFGGEFFSEWRLFFSYQVFGYAIMFPFLRGLQFKKPIEAVLHCAVVVVVPQFFLNCFFQRIYIDTFLGILFGVQLAHVFFTEDKGKTDDVLFLLGCGMLVLTKDAGLFLGLVAVAGYLWKNLIRNRGKKALIRVLLCLAAVFIPWLLWKIEVNRSGCFVAFQELVNIGEYIRIIFGAGEGDRQVIWNNFAANLVHPVLTVSNFGIKIMPVIALVATAGGLFLAKAVNRDSSELKGNGPVSAVAIVLLGAVCYFFGLGAIYLYRIQDVTVSSLPSYNRYVSAYLLGIVVCAAMGIIRNTYAGKGKRIIASVMALVFIILAPYSGISEFVSGKYTEDSLKFRGSLPETSKKVLEYADGRELNVFVLEQGGAGWSFWFYRTLLLPSHVRNNANGGVGELGWSIGSRTKGGIAIEPEELKEILTERYDIFIIDTTDEAFKEDYAILFTDPDEILNGTVFVVNKSSGLLELLE